jgi:hypothetical protein
LKEEIGSIRFADQLYWKRVNDHSRHANAELQRRQDRLQEINKELALLKSPAHS